MLGTAGLAADENSFKLPSSGSATRRNGRSVVEQVPRRGPRSMS